MAYYKYSSVTGELSEISDFQLIPDGVYVISVNDVSKADLEKFYEWNSYSLAFQIKTKRTISKRDFLKRLTPTEYSAIRTQYANDAILEYHWQMIMLSEEVDLDDNDTVAAFDIIQSYNIVNATRRAEILA